MNSNLVSQTWVSPYLSPVNGTRAPWRSGGLQGWGGKDTTQAFCGARKSGKDTKMDVGTSRGNRSQLQRAPNGQG